MINNRKMAWCRAGVLAGLASLVWIASAPEVAGQSGTAPRYTRDGKLLAPVGYETWVFVGSNLGLAYKPDAPAMTAAEGARADKPEFHNVYINPEAYARFRATRQFPDRTVLVMEKFAAAERDTKGVLARGSFNGDRLGMEVAVKNSRRPDGKPTPWAYYDFTDMVPATAFPDDKCEQCHRAHASMDNVWVQFYPTLRKLIR
jgi:cytochrome P460